MEIAVDDEDVDDIAKHLEGDFGVSRRNTNK